MNPKVMFFLPHLGGGGAEMNAVRVGSALHSLGYGVSFAVCRGGGSYERLLPPEVLIHYLPTGRIESSTLRLMRSIAPLRNLIREQKPDILCPVMDAPAVAAIKAVSALVNKPKVAVCIQVSPYSQFVYQKNLRARVLFSLIKSHYAAADHIIALSRGVKSEITALMPFITTKVSVIHNAGIAHGGLTQSAADMIRIQSPSDGKLIVACGRLTEQKGYTYLLEAIGNVLKKEKVYLWILGEGPLRAYLERYSAKLNVSEYVTFLGFKDNPECYMHAADIFVLSSLFEGFGNVIVEAMTCGTPVIASDCPHGPAEIINNNLDGILVPPGDSKALSEAILRVLHNKKLGQRLSTQGMVRARDFAPPVIAKEYAKVFSRLLEVDK